MAAVSPPQAAHGWSRQGLGVGAGRVGVKQRVAGCSADPCLCLQCPICFSFVNDHNTSGGQHDTAVGALILPHSEPLGTSRTKPTVTVNKIVLKAKQ